MKKLLYIGVAALGLSALAICRDNGTAPMVLAAQITPAPASPTLSGTPSPGFVPPAPVETPAPPTPVADPVPNVKGDLVIDFLGGVRGYVEPCGWHSGQYGGIARWATYIKDSRKKHAGEMALFAGGMRLTSGGVADQQVSTLWDAFGQMKFDAATLAPEDLPDATKLPPAASAMLTVANVTTADGKAIAPPVVYRTVTVAPKRKVRVAIIGLLGDSPYGTLPNPTNAPANSQWKVSDPVEVLKTVVPEARKKADVVVVMYAGTREPAKKIIAAVLDIDVMIVGLEGYVDKQVEKVGNTALVQNSERGRYGSSLGITLDKANHPTAFDLQNVAMDGTFADDVQMTKLVQQYHDRIATPVQPVVTSQPGTVAVTPASQWAGSFQCASCHTAEFNQWKDTPHFMAMATLERKDGGQPSRRPDCVPCHVVAYDKPGGYSLTSPRWDLKGVGCEACHGPGQEHVSARQRGVQDNSHMVRNPGKEVCMTCHNKDNSPNFDYATYLPKVMHKPAATTGTR